MIRVTGILLAILAAALLLSRGPFVGTGANDQGPHRTGAQEAPRLRIIATNDFHGALAPTQTSSGRKRGGAGAMAAAIERAQRECPVPCVTLLVDGGDMFQGTAESNLAHGRPVVELYNALGYAAAAVGNHEFDWGLDTLRARMGEAHFSMLGANVRYRDGRDVPWIPDDTIVERGPYRIGIIGVIGPETYTSTLAANVATLRFARPEPIVDSMTRALRGRGADVVVVLAHSGAFCKQKGTRACDGSIIDLAHGLRERVDAIVSGHTHSVVDFAVGGVPVVQASSSGRAVAVVDLAPRSGGEGRSDELLAEEVESVASDARPSAEIEAIIRRADEKVAALAKRRVATLATSLPRRGVDYPLGNLIADAERWAGQADVALVNNGGIRAGLRAGAVTYGELVQVQPFGNPLRRLSVRGAALRAYLERLLESKGPRAHVSGMVIRYDTERRSGSRIVSATMADGTPLRGEATYSLVLNEYMATGSAGRILERDATGSELLGPSDIDALVAYLESRPQPVKAPVGRRFTSIGKR